MIRGPYTEEGSILITILMWLGGILILTTTFLLVGIKVVRTETLFVHQRQAYWMARSEAKAIVKSLAAGTQDQAGWTKSYPFGSIHVQLNQADDWHGQVIAKVAQASDTITFSYSPTLHKIVEWRDNGTN